MIPCNVWWNGWGLPKGFNAEALIAPRRNLDDRTELDLMRIQRIQFGSALLLVAIILWFAGPASAQGMRWRTWRTVPAAQKQTNPPKNPKQKGEAVLPPKEGQGNARGMMGLPPKWVENLREMTPEEQERFMNNNRRFQSLPPERQAQIRQNLKRWNSLTPEQQNNLRNRVQVWEKLTPEQRQEIRTNLLPKWQALPPERKQVLRNRLRELKDLNEEQREARLNDPNFLRGLDAEEQQMLRQLSDLRLGSSP